MAIFLLTSDLSCGLLLFDVMLEEVRCWEPRISLLLKQEIERLDRVEAPLSNLIDRVRAIGFRQKQLSRSVKGFFLLFFHLNY